MTVTMDRMAERTRKVDGKLTSLLDLGYNQVCVYIIRSVGPNAMRQLEELLTSSITNECLSTVDWMTTGKIVPASTVSVHSMRATARHSSTTTHFRRSAP